MLFGVIFLKIKNKRKKITNIIYYNYLKKSLKILKILYTSCLESLEAIYFFLTYLFFIDSQQLNNIISQFGL